MTPVNAKRLFRSRDQRMIAGVCGGLADYFGTDPTWIRLIFVLLFFLGFGLSLLVYLIFWIIMPLAPKVTPSLEGYCPQCPHCQK